MSQTTLYPVVMAGGSGSRLWPLSRVLYPKQFLCLKGDLTMLQTTVNRLHGVECESPVVICNEQHRFIVAEQLRQLNKLTENIILEPAGRNTAPAIALAALAAKRSSPDCDPLMLVLAADHVIQQEEAFRDAVRAAFEAVFKTFPDAHWGRGRHTVAGERGVSEWVFTGTHAEGWRIEAEGCDLFEFRDGLIAVKRAFRKERPKQPA